VSDPGYVQKLVNELSHSADLPFDHSRLFFFRRRDVIRLMAQKIDPIVNRRKRVPRLMAEHCQKPVLAVCNTDAFVGGGVHGRSFSRSMMCEFMAETARTPPAVSWAADIYRASEPPAREEGYRP